MSSLHWVLSEDQPIRLAQQVPGFPVAFVNVPAPISLGTKPKTLMSHHLAHRQNIPGVLRDNVNRYKINLRFGVSVPLTVRVTADSHGIHPPLLDRGSFHLHPPQFRSTLHDEIVSMDVSIGQRQGEAKAYRFMHKSHFAQLAFEAGRMSALPRNHRDRLLLGRSNASAWSEPGSAHWSGKTSLRRSRCKRKSASRKACALFDLYF